MRVVALTATGSGALLLLPLLEMTAIALAAPVSGTLLFLPLLEELLCCPARVAISTFIAGDRPEELFRVRVDKSSVYRVLYYCRF